MSEVIAETGAAEAGAVEPAAPVADPVEQLSAGEAAGVATDGAEPAAAPAVAEPAFDAAEYEARLEYLASQNEQLVAALEQLGSGQQVQPQAQPGGVDLSQFVDEFGQITPEGLLNALAVQQQAITAAMDERFQQFQQPFEQQREAEAYNAGLESAKDMLGDNVARFGEFASDPEADTIARDRVLDRADTLLMTPEFQRRYGDGPRAAEMAIAQAAQEERTYLSSVMGQGAAQAANRLATLAGAAGEPGNGATGAVAGTPQFKSPGDVVRHYAAEARRMGTGEDRPDPRFT